MKDVLDELAAARRKMGTAILPAGEAYTMELSVATTRTPTTCGTPSPAPSD